MAKVNKAQLTTEIDRLKAENEKLRMELAAIKDRTKMISELFKQMVGAL